MSLSFLIFLSVLQGVTELFPVSSLGHTLLVPALFGMHIDAHAPQLLPFLVALHLGTALALLWYFRRRWVALIGQGAVDELVCDMLRSELFKVYARRNTRRRDHMAALIRATPAIGLRHILTEVLAKRASLFRMTNALRALRVPTLVMAGRHDYVCRAPAHLLADNIPNAALAWIDDAGHMAPLENPRLFTARLQAFLTS